MCVCVEREKERFAIRFQRPSNCGVLEGAFDAIIKTESERETEKDVYIIR